jgi:hypothetical protein
MCLGSGTITAADRVVLVQIVIAHPAGEPDVRFVRK